MDDATKSIRPIRLGTGRDQEKIRAAVEAKIRADYGDEWSLSHFETDAAGCLWAYAVRRPTTTVSRGGAGWRKTMELKAGMRVTDGVKFDADTGAFWDAKETGRPAGTNYRLTVFDPARRIAVMEPLTVEEQRVRDALSTIVFSANPWDVEARERPGGGFDVVLPVKYQPSKHDGPLADVASDVIGRPGWWCSFDGATRRGTILPGELPTFPPAIPVPLGRLGGTLSRTPFASRLGRPGQKAMDEVWVDWEAAAFAIVAGLPGSGKSVTLDTIIADELAAGADLVIVDEQDKSRDFLWCKDFCVPGGWGCDSLAHAAAALGLVYEMKSARGALLDEHGVSNWLDIPEEERFKPVLVVVDEYTALSSPTPAPKGIPKDHPLVVAANRENLCKALIANYVNKIIAELRFVGMRLILSTQVTNQSSGVPPGLRSKIGNKILQGSNASRSARMSLFPDESAVPTVPKNVQEGGRAAMGAGVAELEGQGSCVYKGWFAPKDQLRGAILARGRRPRGGDPSPTAGQVARFVPDEDIDDAPVTRRRGAGPDWSQTRSPVSGRHMDDIARDMGDTDGLAWSVDPGTGERLTGYARANAARHAAAGKTREEGTP